jgi:uroporphyrinogen decarboxylase
MTSKERVRQAVQHKQPDRVPADFEAVDIVIERLQQRYGYCEPEQILQRFEIDIRVVNPRYIGPERKFFTDQDGFVVKEDYWGIQTKSIWTGREFHGHTVYYPLNVAKSLADLDRYAWPSADWFDYEDFKRQCDKHRDKAITIGHEGPFQFACFLRSMDKLFMDMVLEPEFAHRIYDRMVSFELEYYDRLLAAADGQVDILRPHDDYGTQISLLFSTAMWQEYFKDNTQRLVDLAHQHGAYFMQHSCGAVGPIIPELIDCGIDILEPIQKVKGLEPEFLKQEYGDRLAFHGGIDTQSVLPCSTADEVRSETRHFIDVLNQNGGYILMASQGFEGDVPLENIEAMYSVR